MATLPEEDEPETFVDHVQNVASEVVRVAGKANVPNWIVVALFGVIVLLVLK